MSEQNNLLQLKKLVAKMTNTTADNVPGATIADVLDLLQRNYAAGGSNIGHVDFTMEEITAEDWQQSGAGMYYIDYKTYEELGLSNITPLALTCIDWTGLPYPFLPCATVVGVGITCETNMSFNTITLRLVYLQN